MHPAGAALRMSGVLRVTPDAAPGGQQSLGVGGDGSHRHTLDVEIRRPAQKVLPTTLPPTAALWAAVR